MEHFGGNQLQNGLSHYYLRKICALISVKSARTRILPR